MTDSFDLLVVIYDRRDLLKSTSCSRATLKRILNTTMEVPPTVFLEGMVDRGGVEEDGESGQSLLPLPLQV